MTALIKRSEHAEQAALMQIVHLHEAQHPDLKRLFAVPNGGKRDRISGARMKAEGQRRGVPDLQLPVRRGDYPGLVLEMKVGRNVCTPEQIDWLAHFEAQGWATAVCYSADAAWDVIMQYLELPL